MRVFNYLLGAILSGLTLLLIFLPFFTPERAGSFIFISLIALPLCIANGVAFALLLWKRNRWWIFFLLLLVGCLPILSNYVPHPRWAKTETIQANRVGIISWNVEGFRLNKDTLRNAANNVRHHQPDIVCLQERPHTNLVAWDTIRAAFPDYPYSVINTREDEVLNLALFSRWPIENVQEYYFPDSYNKMVQADILMEGDTIRLFNVHLQTTGLNDASPEHSRLQSVQDNAIRRNRQADLLMNAIAKSPYPVVVCGDFNDTPASYAYRKISRQLKDCFVQAGDAWSSSYQRWGGLLRIDYIFNSPEFQVENYRLISNPWSDHKQQYGVLYIDN